MPAAARVKRWAGAALALSLGVCGAACDRRFEFDTESGGTDTGGSATTNGGALSGNGGALSGSGGELGGSGGTGAQAGTSAGVSGGGMGGGAGSTACGTVAVCTAGTHCVEGQCAQCAADADCAAYGMPRCEPTRHRCVACVVTADCQDDFACDSLANRCLQTCEEDNTCPVGAHGCDERRQVCYQCDEDRECATSSVGHLCASDGSGCVQCRKDTDCPGQHCDQLSGRCVDCRDGRDCSSQICDPTTFSCAPG